MAGEGRGRPWIYVSLAVYCALPALVVGIVAEGNPGEARGVAISPAAAGFFVFSLLTISLAVLYRIRDRGILFVFGIGVFAFLKSIGVALGFFLNDTFFHLVTGFYFFQALTIGFYFVSSTARKHAQERSGRFFGALFLLLASYAVMALFHHLLGIVTGEYAGDPDEIVFAWFETLSAIPALLYLVSLRINSENLLLLARDSIRFNGRDVGDSFNAFQKAVLASFFSSLRRTIRCDQAIAIEGSIGSDFHCDPSSECKPSICRGYAVVYRKVSDLGKKLRNLGIGTIEAPPNKREIREEGWKLRLFEGVRVRVQGFGWAKVILDARKSIGELFLGDGGTASPVEDRREAGNEDTAQRSRSGNRESALSSIGVAFSGAAFIAAEATMALPAPLVASTGWLRWAFFVASTAAVVWLISTPIRASRGDGLLWNTLAAASALVVVAFASGIVIGEILSFLLAIKAIVLLGAVFLLEFRKMERLRDLGYLRKRLSNALFWILWFYLIALLVLREPSVRPMPDQARELLATYAFIVHDRVLFVATLLVAVFFISFRGKRLSVTRDSIWLEGAPLAEGLAPSNVGLLLSFLLEESGTLHCREIVADLHPDEAESCAPDCKTSVCPAYQRLYKRIREIRKFLETSGLGTIQSPARTADAKREGWKIVLYDDVYVRYP